MERRKYFNIYIVLLLGVVVSGLLSYFGHTALAIIGIFSIAAIKAFLVLGYYMHLSVERAWVKWMLGTAVFCLVILFVGLIPDIVYVYGRMNP